MNVNIVTPYVPPGRPNNGGADISPHSRPNILSAHELKAILEGDMARCSDEELMFSRACETRG
jgi:hypothetical protein